MPFLFLVSKVKLNPNKLKLNFLYGIICNMRGEDMEDINLVLFAVYFILAILNLCGMVCLNSSAVFGMTIGSLLLCLIPVLDSKKIRVIMYVIAFGFIIGFQYISKSEEWTKDIDSNTWLFLSLSVTFLTNFISKNEKEKIEIDAKLEEAKKCANQIETLKDMINKLKNK